MESYTLDQLLLCVIQNLIQARDQIDMPPG
jgi:hypothetical protein